MSSIDQQFIEYIVKSLVGKPDEVKIDRRIDEKGVLLELTVDPEDLGRVIGKRGATAQSLRTLLRALGTKNEARYNLKIVDNGDPRPPRDDATAPAATVATETDDDVVPVDDTSSTDDDQSKPEPAAAMPETRAHDDLDLDDDDKEEEKPAGDKFSKTRKELDDLDDLDI
jgi:predicted RNA-binding protein YlqC (UPF0109 family)